MGRGNRVVALHHLSAPFSTASNYCVFGNDLAFIDSFIP